MFITFLKHLFDFFRGHMLLLIDEEIVFNYDLIAELLEKIDCKDRKKSRLREFAKFFNQPEILSGLTSKKANQLKTALKFFLRFKSEFKKFYCFDASKISFVSAVPHAIEIEALKKRQEEIINILEMVLKALADFQPNHGINDFMNRFDDFYHETGLLIEKFRKYVKFSSAQEARIKELIGKIQRKARKISVESNGAKQDLFFYVAEDKDISIVMNAYYLAGPAPDVRGPLGNVFHSDAFPFPHYNVIFSDPKMNVHVIPKRYSEKFFESISRQLISRIASKAKVYLGEDGSQVKCYLLDEYDAVDAIFREGLSLKDVKLVSSCLDKSGLGIDHYTLEISGERVMVVPYYERAELASRAV